MAERVAQNSFGMTIPLQAIKKQAWIEIGKIAAQNGGGGTSRCIETMDLINPPGRTNHCLEKLPQWPAAQPSGQLHAILKIMAWIPQQRKSQKMLVDMAWLAINTSERIGIAEHIHNFGINPSTSEGQEAPDQVWLCYRPSAIPKKPPNG